MNRVLAVLLGIMPLVGWSWSAGQGRTSRRVMGRDANHVHFLGSHDSGLTRARRKDQLRVLTHPDPPLLLHERRQNLTKLIPSTVEEALGGLGRHVQLGGDLA